MSAAEPPSHDLAVHNGEFALEGWKVAHGYEAEPGADDGCPGGRLRRSGSSGGAAGKGGNGGSAWSAWNRESA